MKFQLLADLQHRPEIEELSSRLSCNIYNTLEDYHLLRDVILELIETPPEEEIMARVKQNVKALAEES